MGSGFLFRSFRARRISWGALTQGDARDKSPFAGPGLPYLGLSGQGVARSPRNPEPASLLYVTIDCTLLHLLDPLFLQFFNLFRIEIEINNDI